MKQPKYPNLFQPSHTFFKDEDGKLTKVSSFKAMLPIYETALELVWGKHGMKATKGYVNHCDHNSYLIVITNSEKDTLVHELYHVVNHIEKELGLESGDANEAQAYLFGYLYKEIVKVINK